MPKKELLRNKSVSVCPDQKQHSAQHSGKLWRLSFRSFLRRYGRLCLPVLLLLVALVNLIISSLLGPGGGGKWRQVLPRRPGGIILHHSATPQLISGKQVDEAFIDRMHARRGFNYPTAWRNYHIGYHYLILGDGTIQPGRPEWMPGSHTKLHNDQLGICLIGDFSSADNPDGRYGPMTPTAAQLKSLDQLLRTLITRYDYSPQDIHRHRDYAQTACPGDRFPFQQVLQQAFRE